MELETLSDKIQKGMLPDIMSPYYKAKVLDVEDVKKFIRLLNSPNKLIFDIKIECKECRIGKKIFVLWGKYHICEECFIKNLAGDKLI